MTKAQQIQNRIDEIRAEVKKYFDEHSGSHEAHLRLTTHLAELQVALSERADLISRRLVRLTWAIVALTFALLFFTVYLYKDTHALVEREQATSPHKAIDR